MRRAGVVQLSSLALSLVGVTGALGLVGVSPAAAASGAYSLVTFDDRITSVPPGDLNPAKVHGQYRDDLGIQFREDTVYAFGSPAEGGLARSGPNALACFDGADACPSEVAWSFVAPQGWIEVWVGYAFAHPDVEIPILITGFDKGEQTVAQSRTTIPPSGGPSPVSVPIWAATDGDATIVRVSVTRPGGNIGGVIIDDVAFATSTPPPDLELLDPNVTLSAGVITVAASVANVGPVPVDAFNAAVEGPGGAIAVPIGAMNPGDSASLNATIELPPDFGGPVAHIHIDAARGLAVTDGNPLNNTFDEDVVVSVVVSSPVQSESPAQPSAAPPTTVPATPAPSDQPGPSTNSTEFFTTLLGLAVIVGVGVVVLGPRIMRAIKRPPIPQTAALHGETTTENGVKVTIDVDGKAASATVEFDNVTIDVDGSGPSSIKVQDGPPPKTCQPLRFGNLADRRCWYAQRQIMVAHADGRVRALTIVVDRGVAVGATEPVPDGLTQRILGLGTAKDREAQTATAVSDLTDLATRVVGSVDGATQLTIIGRVAGLKVPAQITLHACLGSEAEGAFKALKPIQHTWTVMKDHQLAVGPVHEGEPGDSIRQVIAAAIDQAGRAQPLF